MTNEERDIITQFISRVSGAQSGAASGAFSGSVPATAQPPLPPVDREADTLIRDLHQRYPDAAYRLTQLAFVQEHALAEAQNRIKRLEWELQQTQASAQQATQQQQGGGGFFSGLFGGGRSQAPPQPGPGPAWNQGGAAPGYRQAAPPPPPPPQYAPSFQPGMFQRSGSGFLGSALTTAAGVAGGVVAGNALMDLFSGHRGTGEGLAGGYPGVGDSPWGGGGAGLPPSQDYVDQGSWDNTGGAAPSDQNYVDNSSWDQGNDPSGGDSSWDDGGGGFDPGGGGSDDSLC